MAQEVAMRMMTELRHAVAVEVGIRDRRDPDHRADVRFHAEAGFSWSFDGVARLVEAKRIVVCCDRTPAITEQVAVRFHTGSGNFDGGIALIGLVRHVYRLRASDGVFTAFLVRVDFVSDIAPGIPVYQRQSISSRFSARRSSSRN
jgi:hypothetical protein